MGEGPVTQIADGPALKYTPERGKKHPAVVMEDPRVPMLRAKLGMTENADDTHYDAKVAAAVRKFQANADLKAMSACLTYSDGQDDQQPETGSPDRHHHRQHGALALAAARPRRLPATLMPS